ncbi:acyl carrier protein [Streptomyces lacrimifluminis]|uniref:Actinorhodin polyketide synthase acyl carrier protein n=1 Tax=Streptomyces lacrimifluminis TaxID=1500077 RepID=A0A917NQA9_9ACTN|nr:acyl carrier protein [Streptomyces lacrimifluminis]GGJ14847.1 actinorhodin polyketide synthase acyl carrier protein [Streptomyces lacrimifluminis]
MPRMTLDDLKLILDECAGEDERTDFGSDLLDTSFTDLGYDSLALLETAATTTLRFGVELADEAVTDAETPRQFLDLVNTALVKVA